ncbi:MAG: type II secretion system protein N [Pseudomonadota bacterium]
MAPEAETPTRQTGRRGLWGLITLFLIVYLVALLVLFPARVALEQAERHGLLPAEVTHMLTWERAGGTLLNGHLTGIRFADTTLGDVQWGLRPAALLTGRAQLDLQLTPLAAGTAEGRVSVSHRGVEIHQLSGELPATALHPFMPAAAIRLNGRIELHRTRGRLDWERQVHDMQGDWLWHNAAAGMPRAYTLGTQHATLGDQDGHLEVRVRAAPEAELETDGNIRVDLRQEPPRVEGRVRMAPRAQAAPEIEQFLRQALRPAQEGGYYWEARTP